MKKYNIENDQKGGVKITESATGHWMLSGEVDRMLEDLKPVKPSNPFDAADWEEYYKKGEREI